MGTIMTRTNGDHGHATLRVERLDATYDDRPVLHGVDLDLPDGVVTAIVGPNGCGKSTLLKAMARVLVPVGGTVWLDGHAIHRLPTRQVARQVGLLPQATLAPEQLTVADLVARGRYPHRGPFGRWTDADQRAVEDALAATATGDLRDRPVDELSGGQRQRVWIAMVLAQQTYVLLLDEPTTYLDLAHRLEVLRLLRRLNQDRQVTVVMVLHDLHEAARHADHLIAMADGRIVAQGTPAETVTPGLVRAVFGVRCTTVACPVTGAPLIVPLDEADASAGDVADERPGGPLARLAGGAGS
jgi:ABC-type cobalamin/Fe3+-siderophores transport system ATPase subunit